MTRSYTPSRMPNQGSLRHRLEGVARFAALTLLAQAVAHEIVYLIGPWFAAHVDRLPREPHEAYWAPALLVVLAGAAAVMAALLSTSIRLRRRLAELAEVVNRATLDIGRPPSAASRRSPGFARFARLWVAVFAASLSLFVIQENVEHALIEGQAAGLTVLYAHAYAVVLPVFALVSLVAASVAHALYLTVEQLEDAVRRAEGRLPGRPVSRLVRASFASTHPSPSEHGTPGLGRAPPALPA